MFCYTCHSMPPSRLHRQCRGEEYGACTVREPAGRRPRDGLRRPCPEGTVRPPRHRRKNRDRRGARPTVGREEGQASHRRHCASRGGHARAPLLPACAAVHGGTGMWRRRDGCRGVREATSGCLSCQSSWTGPYPDQIWPKKFVIESQMCPCPSRNFFLPLPE